jgi:putative methyltransferase (TIGR04325 family)
MTMRSLAKRLVPPLVLERLKPLLPGTIHFSGTYPSWAVASARASGYDAALILERVREATLKVRDGKARYERDSVLFDEVQHSFPVLAGLLRVASENAGRLSVLDYGGSLGSSYYQCRNFLPELAHLRWGIVEQAHFVECGRSLFQSENLRFFHGIDECMRETGPNVALLSSVLQYVPEPWQVIEELMAMEIPYLVVDRTPFTDCGTEIITIQHVPGSIYKASYPCRLFGRAAFSSRFKDRYEVIAKFDSVDGSAVASGVRFSFGGMILRRS